MDQPGIAASIPAPAPPDMLRSLSGIAAILDPKALLSLRQCIGGPPGRAASPPSDTPIWRLRTSSKSGESHALILPLADGGALLRFQNDDDPARLLDRTLDRRRFAELSGTWEPYAGPWREPPTGTLVAEVFELPKPYIPSPERIDQATLRARLHGGAPTSLPDCTRDLAAETFFVRLPKACSPRHPAGLYVWIDAGTSGKPPAPFNPALDALNLICIGAANSGNERPVIDRYQLALDAVATARARFHTDPARVYVGGISGGGRVSSLMCACFPDTFTGCVPIVGMSSYHDAPAPGGKRFPAAYSRPSARFYDLLRTRRFAPISGEKDFNNAEISAYVQQHRADGLPVRLFDYPDMSHTLPTPARFQEAVEWVDEPARAALAERTAAADHEWASATSRFGEGPPTSPAHRAALEAVVRAGPWSDAAWKAADLLLPAANPAK